MSALAIPAGFAPLAPASPFIEHAGTIYGHADDPCRYGFALRAQHANRQGDAHGGLLFTFADFIIPAALRTLGGADEVWLTVNLGADYFSVARIGDWLEGRVDVLRRGGSLCFAACDLFANELRVARVSGLFKRVRPPE